MCVAAACHVMAGVDEFEIRGIRSAKEACCGGIFGLSVLVKADLFFDVGDVLFIVQRVKDLLNQFLLVGVEGGWNSIVWMDVPPVTDILPSGMIGRQTDFGSLFISQTFIELHGQRIGSGRFHRSMGHGCRQNQPTIGGCGSHGSTGSSQKATTIQSLHEMSFDVRAGAGRETDGANENALQKCG